MSHIFCILLNTIKVFFLYFFSVPKFFITKINLLINRMTGMARLHPILITQLLYNDLKLYRIYSIYCIW